MEAHRPATDLRLLGIAIAGVLALAVPAHAQTKPDKTVRCWTDHGQTVCGDTMPANVANGSQREINASGVTVKTWPRPLTPDEQVAKDAADKTEAARVAAQATQNRQQMALASTYPSEDALRKAYAERSQGVHASLVAAQSSLANHRQELSRTLLRAANAELQGRPVSKQVQDAITLQTSTVGNAFTDLQRKRSDYAGMDAELQQALQQYRDYKQNGGIAPAALPQN